ncbi:hypothetical protein Aca07nite_37160 [Actinoplanes capillaceus]|uniref:YcxB-like C-terminal domain-containing protein n=1 Tax=Actinoplanes campanulatus TaxID=113559 RepID=A0ABQ3WJM9_9ACTN|nr:YcxB family protein [Actinoplanes capillaceus]GID46441.1 hypothetical protein Aca07nite_37160 [Actinoplanes capillaceus]
MTLFKIIYCSVLVGEDTVLTFQARTEAALARPIIRRFFVRTMLFVAVGGLVVAWLIALAGARQFAFYLAVSSALSPIYGPWMMSAEALKRNADKFGRMIAFRIDRTGVQTFTGFSEGRWNWSDVRRVEQRRDQVLVHIGGPEFLCIPTGGLTEDQRAQLKTLLPS